MQHEKPRLDLLNEFNLAPDDALFSQETVCAIICCSRHTLERSRWERKGMPYLKIGRLVRYRKIDIINWINNCQKLAF